MSSKGNTYQNKIQFNESFKRALRPAKQLLGYSWDQIFRAVEITELQANDLGFDWQPQTVLKNIERAANHEPAQGYLPPDPENDEVQYQDMDQ